MDHRPKLRGKIIKFLEDNKGDDLGNLGFGNMFLGLHQNHDP